jgi:predicted lipid-binding transport protein (Tim44 family)
LLERIMNEGFAFFDIIIFAMLAGYLVFQLRRALGRRSDNQEPKSKPSPEQRPKHGETDNVVTIKPNKNKKENQEETLGGLTELREKDPSFSDTDFIKGSKEAFSWIVEAFSKGEISKLEPLLSGPLFNGFKQAIEQREANQLSLETNVVSIKSAQIHNVTVKNDQVSITVEYVTDQIKSTRNSKDEIVDGDPDTIETVTDLWTFNRNIKSQNPNWTLVKTETPSDCN